MHDFAEPQRKANIKHMSRFLRFSNAHPFLSMALAWALFFAIVLTFYPADKDVQPISYAQRGAT